MSLYGKDDSNANKTKAGIGVSGSSQAKTIVFVVTLKHNQKMARGVESLKRYSFYLHRMHGSHDIDRTVSFYHDPEANASETQSDDTIGADITS